MTEMNRNKGDGRANKKLTVENTMGADGRQAFIARRILQIDALARPLQDVECTRSLRLRCLVALLFERGRRPIADLQRTRCTDSSRTLRDVSSARWRRAFQFNYVFRR